MSVPSPASSRLKLLLELLGGAAAFIAIVAGLLDAAHKKGAGGMEWVGGLVGGALIVAAYFASRARKVAGGLFIVGVFILAAALFPSLRWWSIGDEDGETEDTITTTVTSEEPSSATTDNTAGTSATSSSSAAVTTSAVPSTESTQPSVDPGSTAASTAPARPPTRNPPVTTPPPPLTTAAPSPAGTIEFPAPNAVVDSQLRPVGRYSNIEGGTLYALLRVQPPAPGSEKYYVTGIALQLDGHWQTDVAIVVGAPSESETKLYDLNLVWVPDADTSVLNSCLSNQACRDAGLDGAPASAKTLHQVQIERPAH